MNPILNMLNQNTPSPNGVVDLIKASPNPSDMITNLVKTNPQVKQTMDIVNQYNGDPKKAFFEIARQRGIDPQSILSQLNM